MSLRLKMILGIGAILLLVIAGYAIMTVRSQSSQVRDLTEREAELIALLAERAIARAMTAGKSEEVQGILEEIGEVPYLAGIRIVDPGGRIFRSSQPAERGQLLGRQPHPPVDKGAGPGNEAQDRSVVISRPILNRQACYTCHGQDRTALGFLNVRLPLPSAGSQVAHQWTFIILPAMVALVAAGGLIALYFTLVMGRRIESFSRTMRRVEAGDLTAKVPEEGRDELGRLGKSFNTMVVRLADAQRRLENRHAEEIRRAEHMASLGKMAAGIAHEINNPLAGMQNCVKTLFKGARDDGQRLQYLSMLQEGLGRVGRIMGQLLDFAREAKPQLARTDLGAVIGRCLSLLEHEMAVRNISCSLAVESELPILLADPHQLEQVFLNILMNAMDATPEGGRLDVSARLRHDREGPFAEVKVTDTGMGIPAEDLSRIFDPFFTTKEVGKGTGLGLSVSYGIVRAHGGLIDVQSEIGRGSSFTVTLPVRAGGGGDGSPDSPGGR